MHTRLRNFSKSLAMIFSLLLSPYLFADVFTVTFLDRTTDQPITDTRVIAKEIMPDGTLEWRQRKTTNASGIALFDLDFEGAKTYLFEIKAFNNFTARLGHVTAAHNTQVYVGNQVIQALDGTVSSQPAFANRSVKVEQYQADGSVKTIANVATDENGQLKLDLAPGNYRLKTKTSIADRWVLSADFDHTQQMQFVVGELPLELTLTHAVTGAPIANQDVAARRITADGSKWYGRKTTDAQGKLVWEMRGLNAGQVFQFSTKYFGKFDSKTEVSASGSLNWSLGKIQVALQDATQEDSPALANYEVKLKRVVGESSKYLTNLSSDENGNILLDLLDISASQPYLLEARSPTDNSTKYTKQITHNGQHQFQVGSTPLNILVKHAQTGAVLPGIDITLHELKADGGRKWLAQKSTDANGRFSVDLPDLGNTQSVQLSTKLFNNHTSFSTAITQKGEFEWQLGSLQVTLLNGNTDTPTAIANHTLEFLQQEGDALKVIKRLRSDESGKVLIDLPDLTAESPYLLRARSLIDNASKYEKWISATGAYDLVIGSKPLNVQLTHARSGQVLADKPITLQKWHAEEQKFKYFKRANTDALGKVSFDVPDFDGETQFRLEIRAINNFRFYSEPFVQAGDMHLTAGKTQVVLKDGSSAQQAPLANYNVQIKTYDAANNKYRYYAGAKTDDQGVLQLDLPAPSAGEVYLLQAKSLTDNKNKSSDPIGTSGDFEFVVGNQPVTVQVYDLVNNQALAAQRVVAQQQDADQNWQNVKNVTTNDDGQAIFDLPGIGQGQEYRFKVNKYHGSVYSETISAPSELTIDVGALPVVLSERESGELLTNVQITAYKYADDGELSYVTAGNTDESGQVVFDLSGLGQSRYILRARRPFADVRHIYSPVIFSAGPFEFVVSEHDDTSLDTEAPSISIFAPENDQVADNGFILAGLAEDDKQLQSVTIQVWDSLGNLNEFSITPAGSGDWSAHVPGEWLTANAQIGVAATAYDRMGNHATSNRQYDVVADTEAPQISILSHQNQDSVSQSGFTVSGTASDNIQVSELTATISDSNLGAISTDEAISVDPQTGQWAIYMSADKLTGASELSFAFSLKDTSDNSTSESLQLLTLATSPAIKQLVHRATFGPTPTLESEIAQMGAQNWIEQQLSPAQIDDSEVEQMLSRLQIDGLDDLRTRELIYQTYSKRQLQQVMAWFWENHFSTEYRSHRKVAYEESENRLFREHALGNFIQLLEVSAKSPAMLTYLNNVKSRVGQLNENYARELMELHTLGVDGGYTAEDIIALARILTGWRVSNGQFDFSLQRHDRDNKFFLGEQVLGGGVEEGEQVLVRLSRHPSTARFICGKLVRFWISDAAIPALQSSCAATFSATDGDIAAVLRVIFNSSEFNQAGYVAAKVKTPLELYVSAMRATQAEPDWDDGIDIISDLGMPLFDRPAPDGFGDVGDDWINTDAMAQRTKFALRLVFRHDGGEVDLLNQLDERGIRSADAIIDYLFNLMLTATNSDLERQQALAIMNEGEAFSMQANDAQRKLNRLLATIMSYPGFQYQ